VSSERAGELEGIALTPAEDAVGTEGRGSDVNDSHLVLPLLTLGDPQRLTGGYLYHLRMAEAAPQHGAKIVFLSFPQRTFPTAALRAPALFRHAQALPADAILLDSIAAALAAPWLALRRPRVPVIAVLHQPPGGIDHRTWRTTVQARLDRLAYWRTVQFIVASEPLAAQVAAQGIARERVRVVPPGRDVAQPPEGPPPDLRRGRGASLLCVANLIDRKGILELLDALAPLPVDAATLHIVGDDQVDPAYAARVRRRLADPRLATRVVLHGPLSQAEVAALYAAADVFVLPAFREPYGTVWGEAMAFGLPVVGWRAGNLPHLADEGREGLLVSPGDVGALTRALAMLLADEPLRRRLGSAARRRALSRPTWRQSATAFFAAIKETLGSAPAPATGAASPSRRSAASTSPR
jgi:glycosyltransferase involved in cell wall biosynthesis